MSGLSDHASRTAAVDPTRNVVLEASAGTGKTRVLVERYVNLLRAGADPDHILAITFTRKAAAEMRERIIDRLREASRLSEFDRARWRDLAGRLGDIAVSTIDAFCLALLREFPLDANIDPGFDLADDTQAPRLVRESLDAAMRICRRLAAEDDDVGLVFAQLGEARLRAGLGALLERRLVAPQALDRYLASGPRNVTAAVACAHSAEVLRQAFRRMPGGIQAFMQDGPRHHPQFAMLSADLLRLVERDAPPTFLDRPAQAAWRDLLDRLRGYFLTQDGRPRNERFAGTSFTARDCDSEASWRRHRAEASAVAPMVAESVRAFRRDLNVVLARGVWRVFGVALGTYHRTLDAHGLLDFSGVLERAIALLGNLEEFAHSRFVLEARFRHVLVDEFQDTSRAQWALVSQLVKSWGAGLGVADEPLRSSIFIVGDRKQSIYGFRDADVAVLDTAGQFVEDLRSDGAVRYAISVSFRSKPEILAFINDVCGAIEKSPQRADAFRYESTDRFPVSEDETVPANRDAAASLGVVVGASMTETAGRVAREVTRLLNDAVVRDRVTGVSRPAVASDMAILFRSRDAHREFEKALEHQGVLTYVYKGLGFFDADEVQDVVSLMRYLAEPASNARATALLRSRIARVSDPTIAALAPRVSGAILDADSPAVMADDATDVVDRRRLHRLREAVPRWCRAVDRRPAADLLRDILTEVGYAACLAGPRQLQARENIKKLFGIIRRFHNHGYATLARLVDHLEALAVGDESNAAIDATGAVSLMTVHAAKGLEFPIVFVVNMHRGTGTARAPIRIVADVAGAPSVAVADYQSEGDDDAAARDREETKRLLYVALTRARDRLYLGAVVRDGVFRPTRGSLGEVLPSGVRDVFKQAASGQRSVQWTGETAQHVFNVLT